MRFTFFGSFHPDYPRNAVIRKGLVRLGSSIRICRASPSLKAWARYPLLLGKYRFATDIIFVPEFCQKDMPLARLLGFLSSKKVIFDPLAARYETKVVDWRRIPSDSPAAWWNRQIDLAAFAAADLILADTAAHKAYYCDAYGVKPEKIEVLPLGYDDDLFPPSADSGSVVSEGRRGRFRVLFFGSFLPLHGAEVIVAAAKIVAVRDPSIEFRMVGSGQTLERTRAAAVGLKNIEFRRWLMPEELRRAVDEADVCLGIFGRTEKARRVVPHKIFQSMGLGKAVVTARTPAAGEIFRDMETIAFCDEPLEESLAATVLELKNDPGLRRDIGRRGQALMRDRYSPPAIGRGLLEMIRKHFGKG